jgi:enoyl-CoA hydratase/carnithine racemase
MGEFVRLEVSDGVGTIRLDRPKLNAIDSQVTEEIAECAKEAERQDDVGAIVVWGGRKVFAAGADVKQLSTLNSIEVKPIITHMQECLNILEDVPKITIAAINGFALGGGLELAMAADLRYAAAGAKLGQPEIQLGIIPGAGGTQRLPRLVGLGRAKDMIYTGRSVRAEEALEIGLVDRVFPADEVYERAVEDARKFANGPTQALRAAKIAINWGTKADLGSGLIIEREAFIDLFSTEDQKTGMRSLLEDGPGKAKFQGR